MSDRSKSSFWGRKVPQSPGAKIILPVDHQELSNNLLQVSDSFCIRWVGEVWIPWPFQLKNSKTVRFDGDFSSPQSLR